MKHKVIYSVLLTRPAHQNKSLIQSIQAMGHQVLILPTMAIEHNINRNINLEYYFKKNVKINLSATIIIITSQNALWALSSIELACLKEHQASLSIITMGAATTELAKAKGLHVHYTPLRGSTSEDVLKMDILQTARIEGQSILILTGQDSSNALVSILNERGAKVDTLLLYKRQCIEYQCSTIESILKPWLSLSKNSVGQTKKIIFISSQNGFDNLLKIIFGFSGFDLSLALGLYHIPIVVPSERIQRYIQSKGFYDVRLSVSAHDEDMLSVLSGG